MPFPVNSWCVVADVVVDFELGVVELAVDEVVVLVYDGVNCDGTQPKCACRNRPLDRIQLRHVFFVVLLDFFWVVHVYAMLERN